MKRHHALNLRLGLALVAALVVSLFQPQSRASAAAILTVSPLTWNIILTDTKPAFLDILSITISPNPGLTPVISGNTFAINFGTVRPTDVYVITVVTRVNAQGQPPGGANQVSLTTSSTTDRVFNNAASASLQIIPSSGGGTSTLPETGFAPNKITDLGTVP